MTTRKDTITWGELKAILLTIPDSMNHCLVVAHDGEYYVTGVEWNGIYVGASGSRWGGPKVNFLCH